MSRVGHLRCEYLADPLGIDEPRPRLSWNLETDRRGARQTAWRVRVASTPERLAAGQADGWDSGRREGAQTTQVEYEGRPLAARAEAYWSVECWDETGGAALVSEPARWSMGLLSAADWTARWIAAGPEVAAGDATTPGAAAYFRRLFELAGGRPRRAVVYASARGAFDLKLNGKRISEDIFSPEWTDYTKRIPYRTYDVTPLLQSGANDFEAILADGWWSGFLGWQEQRCRYGRENSLIVQLELEYPDGTRQTIGTDSSWTSQPGPIQSADFQMGERYDARLEPAVVGRTAGPASPGQPVPSGAEGRPGLPPGRPPERAGPEPDRVATPDIARGGLPGSTSPGRSRGAIRPPERAGPEPDRVATPDSARGGLPGSATPATVAASEDSPSSNPAAHPELPRARQVPPPEVPLVALKAPPVRITETLSPVSITPAGTDTWIVDFGQNFAGWVRLRVRGLTPGTEITLRHGERLNPDGSLYTTNLRRARATDTYLARGGPEEIWEPRFTFHGFQYLEATMPGLAGPPPSDTFTGCVIHTAFEPAGTFACSHPGVTRLWLNGAWSQRGNSLSVPTDCPQRDERLGWTGDAQVFLRTATCNFDVAAFMSKWMVDVEDAQTPDGIFPDTAPRLQEGGNWVGLDGLGGAAGWADAGVIVPYTLWRVYGDLRVIARHWRAMQAWLGYLAATNPDGIRRNELGNNYGDWLCLPSDTRFRVPSPMKTLLGTAYWADDAAKMARMAQALGLESAAAHYAAEAARVRAAFQAEFWQQARLTVETQTAYVLVLALNLVPDDARPLAAQRLAELIAAENGHLSTGFIGISHLNPTLTLAGRGDLAYDLLVKEDYPSWLYPIRHGATTIWERWNGWTESGGFFDPTMNSFNHYSLGSIGEWLFRHVAGIELDDTACGFSRFILRPYLPPRGQLTWARATYRCPHGEISSAWELRDGRFHWKFRVPPNTRARVYVPGKPESEAWDAEPGLYEIS